ncbi:MULTISPECIES: winged helix-turn-helix domain-containing protein [Arthrobacter]|uniref:winged helix-turn-helix domain-containing protein n=1 Tax=Arthrobacter TaxID=1663 RepID=UPI00082562E2|nr:MULTISPECIES: winged helix-turn-helix domain-containing protein [Arthrobacter]PSS44422.1 ArsR family transcriptional regulator [Arthrobacter woluwensis]QTF72530.1 winged helix-turn-helix transcriptional regulator [Arthrobacter woluwensis]
MSTQASETAQEPRRQVEISDPKAIRALAHAARLAAISDLYSSQVSRTATELAAVTGLTPSAMSYHLRALQKWGMVEPAESDGDARERRWKAAGTDFMIKSVSGSGHPELAILDLELDAQRRRILAHNQERDELTLRGAEDQRFPSMSMSTEVLYLDPPKARELIDRMNQLIREYAVTDRGEATEDTRRVSALWSIVPDSAP